MKVKVPANVPKLPDEVLSLADDIIEELMNGEHCKRIHGERSCYTAGCRGPLCQSADRLFNRERYARIRAEQGKPYQPSDLRRDDRDSELAAALAVYLANQKIVEIVARLAELYTEMEKAV